MAWHVLLRRVCSRQQSFGMQVKLQKSNQQQLWAEAQRRCRLSDEAVQMAKDLGIGPRSLIKNIPAPTQPWKAPVEDWVRDMYAKRQRTASHEQPSGGGGATAVTERIP